MSYILDCEHCCKVEIECCIQGTVFHLGAPVGGAWVEATDGVYVYRGQTEVDGSYVIIVPCDTALTVYVDESPPSGYHWVPTQYEDVYGGPYPDYCTGEIDFTTDLNP